MSDNGRLRLVPVRETHDEREDRFREPFTAGSICKYMPCALSEGRACSAMYAVLVEAAKERDIARKHRRSSRIAEGVVVRRIRRIGTVSITEIGYRFGTRIQPLHYCPWCGSADVQELRRTIKDEAKPEDRG